VERGGRGRKRGDRRAGAGAVIFAKARGTGLEAIAGKSCAKAAAGRRERGLGCACGPPYAFFVPQGMPTGRAKASAAIGYMASGHRLITPVRGWDAWKVGNVPNPGVFMTVRQGFGRSRAENPAGRERRLASPRKTAPRIQAVVAAATGLLLAVGAAAPAATPAQTGASLVMAQDSGVLQPVTLSVPTGAGANLERVSITSKVSKTKKPPAKKAKARAAKKKAASRKRSASKAARAGRIVSIARKGIGKPYAWGGTGPRGWDCSGFVGWVHSKAGVKLPRVKQWTVMTRTSKPKPGDLVVQNGGSHVGIYTGHGKMISALGKPQGTLAHPVSWMPAKFYTLR
jgi:peptidoglycan DL-endopeptidase CwlO